MKTIKSLLATTSIPETLVRNTIRQFGGWETFKECADDVVDYGIDGGFSGFIYNNETVKFYANNRKAIIQLARSEAQECDETTVDMVAAFRCVRKHGYSVADVEGFLLFNDAKHEDYPALATAMAWYAAEAVCRAYVEAVL